MTAGRKRKLGIFKKYIVYVSCAALYLAMQWGVLHMYIALSDVYYMRHINGLSLPADMKIVYNCVELTDEGGWRVMARAIVETERYYNDVRKIVEGSKCGDQLAVISSSQVTDYSEWPDGTWNLADRVRRLEENKRPGSNYYVINENNYSGFLCWMREWVEILIYVPVLMFIFDIVLFLVLWGIICWANEKEEMDLL
ncbi:MAG: hypothetical protein IKN07_09315 [Lachnospiraceae bacterium]|nr:hypothetical protein [Lachnospiraceae bacterium]